MAKNVLSRLLIGGALLLLIGGALVVAWPMLLIALAIIALSNATARRAPEAA